MSDIITTIDDTQSSLLIREGFDSERLYITGNPSFDMLPAYGANFTDVKRSEVLSEFGLDAKTLFFYAGTSFESDSTKNGFWDLDNIKVFHEVFVKLTSEEKKTCGLVVKLHPRQPKVEQDKIKAYISTEIGGDNVLFYTGNISMSDIICATDLTVTSVSTSAIEAINLGHPAVSLQPGLTGFDDLFFATNSGKIGCAYTHDDAVALLLNAYRSSEFRAKLMAQSKSVQTDGLATKRVVDLVYATLGK